MDWDEFINKNRAQIDEFLGPNNAQYTIIALKGHVATEFNDDVRSLDYFRELLESGKTIEEQNVYLRKLLEELRYKKSPPHPQMKFGLDSKLLIGKDKDLFMNIMIHEFLVNVNYNDVLNELSTLDQSLFKEFQRQGRFEDSMKFLRCFLKKHEILNL